jgi:hypothetical protein
MVKSWPTSVWLSNHHRFTGLPPWPAGYIHAELFACFSARQGVLRLRSKCRALWRDADWLGRFFIRFQPESGSRREQLNLLHKAIPPDAVFPVYAGY